MTSIHRNHNHKPHGYIKGSDTTLDFSKPENPDCFIAIGTWLY